MDLKIEESFVNKYISKNKRNRIYHELSNTKKRRRAIGRFCHNAMECIDNQMIKYQGEDFQYGMKLIRNFNDKECYLISWDDSIDGCLYEPLEAINKMDSIGMPSIAIFSNFCIIKTEQIMGAAEIFILE